MGRKEVLKTAYEYLRSNGLAHTQKDVAAKLNKPATNVSSAFNGKSDYLTDYFLTDFNAAYGNLFNTDWLLTGKGNMLTESNKQNIISLDRIGIVNKMFEYLQNSGKVKTINDLANLMRVPKSTIYNAFRGQGNYLTEDFFDKMNSISGNIFNKKWYETGEGSMLENDITKTNKFEQIETPQISYTKGKPYYDVDLLGGFDVIINDQTTVPSYLIDFKKYDDADCWCNITGHSMEPLISHGDIIAIKEMKEWREFILFGELYGIITNDMRTVKIVTRSTLGNEFLQLVPVNKSGEYQPQDIPVKLITHVFKILGCMKKL